MRRGGSSSGPPLLRRSRILCAAREIPAVRDAKRRLWRPAESRGTPVRTMSPQRSPGDKNRDLWLQTPGKKLRERVHVIVMRAIGEHAAGVQEIVNPPALRQEPTVGPRVREPGVARLDDRRRGLGARVFP